MTPAQARVLARLESGEVIYAWNSVSRATAFALVRQGRAEWAVEPYTSSRRAARPGSRIRYQLEWGIRATVIRWHLDPVVTAIAVYGGYVASVWWRGDGEAAWCVHASVAELPAASGPARDMDDARQQAETALRLLARKNAPA